MTGQGSGDGQGASKGRVLLLLCGAQFMLTLDFAIVNVALPSMQRSLGFTSPALQWVVGAYALFFGGLLLVGGRAGDFFGRKRMFVAGMAAFTVASLLGGLARDPAVLITARALQGLSAAAASPAVLALIAALYPEGKPRAKAMGVFGAVASAGFAGGVLAGGVLTDLLGWRSVMFVNVPVGIILIAAAGRMLATDHVRRAAKRIDVPGALLVTAGLFEVVYALTMSATHAWQAPVVVWPLAGGCALVAGFVIMQAWLNEPLVPLGIFRNRSVAAGNAIAFLSGGVMSISTYFLTLYLQRSLDYSPLKAGLAFFPQAFVVVLASRDVAKYTGKLGPRPLLAAGAVLLTAGSLLLALVPARGSFWDDVLPGGVLLGLGVTTMMITTAVAATAGVPGPQLGLASGLYNSSRQLGVSLCLAIAVTLAGVGPGVHIAISSYRDAFGCSAVLSVLIAALAVVVLPRRRPAPAAQAPAPALAAGPSAEG